MENFFQKTGATPCGVAHVVRIVKRIGYILTKDSASAWHLGNIP